MLSQTQGRGRRPVHAKVPHLSVAHASQPSVLTCCALLSHREISVFIGVSPVQRGDLVKTCFCDATVRDRSFESNASGLGFVVSPPYSWVDCLKSLVLAS